MRLSTGCCGRISGTAAWRRPGRTWRQRVTDRHFKRQEAKTPVVVQAAEVVQRFIDEDRAETVYSARYNGLYEEGFIAPGPVDELMQKAPSRYEQPARLLAEHAAIF